MRWLSPYRIYYIDNRKVIYGLSKLDGILLKGIFTSSRLKRYRYRPPNYIRSSIPIFLLEDNLLELEEEEYKG